MRFIDMFAGIGGFHLGMEQAGHTCVGWIEWDKFARQSYQAIHDVEGIWNASDIRTVRASELPRADCWCFGFPCQDISVAGKQKGFTAGKRSSLFFTVTGLIRDLEEEDRPSYLLIENVKNLLSINRGFDFLKLQIELDEIGYDVEWDVLDSAEVVPQHRERIFIVGHLRGRRTQQVFPIVQDDREVNRRADATNTLTTRYGEAQGSGSYVAESEPPKVKQAGNLMNTKYFGGNPQPGRVYDPSGISPTLSTMQGGGREPKIIANPHGYNKGGVRTISPTVTAGSFKDNNFVQTNIIAGLRIRKLTPLECWRLQGFPDWAFTRAREAGLSDSQLYKQAGNSVTVPVIKAIAERMELSDRESKQKAAY
ncbi:DNA cytosine methyltransferase [Lactiplantibacillus plantarum]|uniref:DNA cytosine methyltransferase n=1 Tax=Lactiplantibacillus plantarum TaxID=1590 RepID=UPI000787AA4F|nr:DNA cytosine methyltransferase [Lactiplantibacillus plantarum]KYK53839.1 DNA cytosine methyltransferase [Lactiplantibacillus plantarum]KYM68190.1 DNA cytosine methyltransferase [Lactiplantibacillus plantarum]